MSTATYEEREAAFQRDVERKVPYFAAIREAGDLPWFENPEKLAKLETVIDGISEMSEMDARRTLWMRRYPR